ncbi:uncharacterized protein LOC134785888 [Penaeus indicus]|uniref:uncharacterized protein LOC134785888 n=1 Tax=Penaeus indicus TaxID=29960 RepID=UPI00300CD1F9
MNEYGPSLNMSLNISLSVMLLALVVPGLGLSPSMLISQVTLSQLLEEMSKLMQTNSTATQQVPEIVPSSACTDDPQTRDCSKVVENDLCFADSFYTRYCCRSCTLAGKIPVFGPHLGQEVEAPLKVKITSDKERYLRGSDMNVTCLATGYPAPEIYWFQDDDEISSLKKYQEDVTDVGGILTRTVRSDLIVRNYTELRYIVKFKCIAINRERTAYAQKEIRIDNAEINIYPRQGIFKSSQDPVITCVIKGINLGNATWNMPYTLRHGAFTIVESRREENGMTVIQSNVTIFSAQLSDIPEMFGLKCSSTNETYRDLGVVKEVYIIKDVEISSNCTDSNSETCYEYRKNCNDIMKNHCCKTCTLMNHTRNNPYGYLGDIISVSAYGDRSRAYGDKVSIKCYTTCTYGKQDVRWYKDGEEISNSDGYYIKDEFELEMYFWQGVSELIILNVRVKDVGIYKCRVTHGQKTDEDSVLVRFNEYGNIGY